MVIRGYNLKLIINLNKKSKIFIFTKENNLKIK